MKPHDPLTDLETPLPPPPLLVERLIAYSRSAIGVAEGMLTHRNRAPDNLEHAREARVWMASAREALEARRLAEEPLTDGERQAAATALRELRRRLDAATGATKAAERQRDQLAKFMTRMAGEYRSAGSEPALRHAGRLERAVSDVMGPQDDDGEEPHGHAG